MDAAIIELQHPAVTIEIHKVPSIKTIFTKALLLSLVRKQGVINHSYARKIEINLRNITPDLQQIKRFTTVCSCTGSATAIPTVYPETIFIGLLGTMITSSFFPLSPIGLVHTGQSIIQYRPIMPSEILDAHCRLDEIKRSDRGIEILCALEIRSGSELVWEGTTLFLSRNKAAMKNRKKKSGKTVEEPLTVREVIEVPKNTGLRYAAASGDYNPHHLYWFSARLLGFKRPIAHGMWSLARSISGIEKASALHYPLKVEAAFKLPIFMPARIALGYEKSKAPDTDDDVISFELKDEQQGLPHLVGTIRSYH